MNNYEDEPPHATRSEMMDEMTNKILAEQIEDRKRQAADRRIAEKAEMVARHLGRDLSTTLRGEWIYQDSSLSIQFTNDLGVYIKIKPNDGVMFKQVGHFDLATSKFVPKIESYIPGPWEEALDALNARALVRAEERKADEERALRAQWGL